MTIGLALPLVAISELALDDVEWSLDHSLRRYRVRPWRQTDGDPAGYTFPCVTVIDYVAHRKLPGWPVHGSSTWPRAQDTDAFGAWCFAENSRLFRGLS
jgi:hypothetical protein